jgi:hypothetical protein
MTDSVHADAAWGDPADEERERLVTRRGVLRGASVGVLTISVAGTAAVSYRAYDNRLLGPTGGTAFDAWRHWRDEPGPRGMVAAAVLAASPHNTQPWIFRVGETRIDLLAAPGRRMAAPDPYGREMHVGLGCALENLFLAARARGYEPRTVPSPRSSTCRAGLLDGRWARRPKHRRRVQRSRRGAARDRSCREVRSQAHGRDRLQGDAAGGAVVDAWHVDVQDRRQGRL